MDICLSPARAAASRRNGAKSRGPKTPEGKARSAQNALKHGMRAQQCIVLPGERAAAFEAFEAALLAELAPEGALQAVLAQRVVAASWRLARAERLEAELFAQNMLAGHGLGLALIRDCNNARAFDTLLRYRGGTLAELWRALRTLKALQAEAAAPQAEIRGVARPAPEAHPSEVPIEPESRRNSDEIIATSAAELAAAPEPVDATAIVVEPRRPAPAPCPRADTPGLEQPIKPDSRRKPCLRAAPSNAIASGSMLQPCAPDEDRNLQHQQCRPPAAEPARMAARGEAGCRLPAGAQGDRRELSAGSAQRCRL
jgi:hypothetical protein